MTDSSVIKVGQLSIRYLLGRRAHRYHGNVRADRSARIKRASTS